MKRSKSIHKPEARRRSLHRWRWLRPPPPEGGLRLGGLYGSHSGNVAAWGGVFILTLPCGVSGAQLQERYCRPLLCVTGMLTLSHLKGCPHVNMESCPPRQHLSHWHSLR